MLTGRMFSLCISLLYLRVMVGREADGQFFVCICLLHVRLIVGCKVDGPLWVVLGRFRRCPPRSVGMRSFKAIELKEPIANCNGAPSFMA